MAKPASHQIIETADAPAAIGAYSQAVQAGDTIYVSGQIALDPASGELVGDDIEAQVERVFSNIEAVARAAGATLSHAVKFTIYLIDMDDYAAVNKVMQATLHKPFPARAAVAVAALPKAARVEADAVFVLG